MALRPTWSSGQDGRADLDTVAGGDDNIEVSLARKTSDDGASAVRVVVRASASTIAGGWSELEWSSGPLGSALAPWDRQDPGGANLDTGGELRQCRDAERLLTVDRRDLPALCSNFAGPGTCRGHRRDKIPNLVLRVNRGSADSVGSVSARRDRAVWGLVAVLLQPQPSRLLRR